MVELRSEKKYTIEEGHQTSVFYYRVDDINKVTSILESRDVTFVRNPHLTAGLKDHKLWIGFFRDPDKNLISILSKVSLEAKK